VDSVVGQNALHVACQAGCVRSVRFVLDILHSDGVKRFVNAKTSKFGLTPLHYVLRLPEKDPRRRALHELLVAAGADPSVADAHGRTSFVEN
jgi:hypothetical protein